MVILNYVSAEICRIAIELMSVIGLVLFFWRRFSKNFEAMLTCLRSLVVFPSLLFIRGLLWNHSLEHPDGLIHLC